MNCPYNHKLKQNYCSICGCEYDIADYRRSLEKIESIIQAFDNYYILTPFYRLWDRIVAWCEECCDLR